MTLYVSAVASAATSPFTHATANATLGVLSSFQFDARDCDGVGLQHAEVKSFTYYLLFTTYYLLLTTYYLLLYYLLLTTYYVLLTTIYYLLLTAYDSLLTTYYSLLAGQVLFGKPYP